MQLIKSTAHHVHAEPYQPQHDTRECRAARKRGAAAVIHSFCNTHPLFAIGLVLNGKEMCIILSFVWNPSLVCECVCVCVHSLGGRQSQFDKWLK